MTIQVFEELKKNPMFSKDDAKSWIYQAIRAALKEYLGVWMAKPRLDSTTGLSKFHPEGLGIPPETEGKVYLLTRRVSF